MATIADLVANGNLVHLGGGLEDDEQPNRLLYALPHVITWLDETLPGLEADFHEGKQDPLEQLDDLFYSFVRGEDFSFWERSHSMRPTEPGVWELKTPDIRLFGWFAAPCVFVIAEVNTAFACKEHDLYAGYRGSVVRRREALELDEPKFITGEYSDVL